MKKRMNGFPNCTRLISSIMIWFVLGAIMLSDIGFAEQVPNVMKDGDQGQQQVITDNYSEDGRNLINNTVDKGQIQMPSAGSYYDRPQIKYISVAKKNSGYAYRKPEADKNNLMSYPYHGVKVLAVAEQGGFTCIVYHGNDNKEHAAWVVTSSLDSYYPGIEQTIGRPCASQATNIGDVAVSWSNDNFVGTEQKYTILDEPAHNCVQFTLDYQVIGLGGTPNPKQVLGPRTVYVNDGSGWVEVGEFDFNEYDAMHVVVNLSEPTDVLAVATSASCDDPNRFVFRQSLLDVMVADQSATGSGIEYPNLNTGTVSEAVLEARSGIVHVYLLFYDEQGSLIALNSGAGILTPGAVFRDESFPESWNCVLTSLSCVDISRMPNPYASYQIVVVADGNIYRVKQVGGLPDINKELALLFMEDYIPNRNFIGLTQIKLLKDGEAVYALGFPEPTNPYAPEYESYEDEEIIRAGNIIDMDHIESDVSYVLSNIGTERNLIGGALVNSEGHLVGLISCNGGTEETLAIPCDVIADLLETANMPLAYGNIDGLEFDK